MLRIVGRDACRIGIAPRRLGGKLASLWVHFSVKTTLPALFSSIYPPQNGFGLSNEPNPHFA
jgi:hypothetical protein